MNKMKLSALLHASEEQTENNGEDAYSLFFKTGEKGIIAVYGGFGAEHYPSLNDRTGANIASVLAAYVADKFYDMDKFRFDGTDSERLCDDMKNVFRSVNEKIIRDRSEESENDRTENLSVSAAIAALNIKDDAAECEYIWAGNARGYILNRTGLHLITDDDCEADDDFEFALNSSEPKNFINAEKDFRFNEKKIIINKPSVIITATNGAYSRFTMPMEFESILLGSLYYADSIEVWQKKLENAMHSYSDYSVTAAACGFETFSELWDFFRVRYESLISMFIKPAKNADTDTIRALWNEYRKNYYDNGDFI